MTTKNHYKLKGRFYLFIKYNFFFFLLIGIITIPISAQITINGSIVDKELKKSLSDVNVFIENTFEGTYSDRDGRFELVTYIQPPFNLILSSIGFKTSVIEIRSNQVNLVIELEKQSYNTNDIVITAKKRDQLMQSVPASISVIDKSFMDQTSKLNNVGDLTLYTPGFSGFNFGNQLYTIRGIGSDGYGMGLESSVGVFLDEIYTGRVTENSSLLDVERIEIIKGPQNTLFGRNASAGAISITTVKPKNRTEVGFTISLGNEGQKSTEYIFNLPLLKNLFLRVAGSYKYRDGLRIVTNQNNQQLSKVDLLANRLALRWRTDNLWTVDFSVEYQRENMGGWDIMNLNTDLGSSGDPFIREIELNRMNIFEIENTFSKIEAKKIISGNLYLKSLSAFRSSGQPFETDGDATPIFILDFLQQINQYNFTQELKLVGTNEKIDWLVTTNFSYENNIGVNSLLFDDHFIVGGVPISENMLGFEHSEFSVCDDISESIFGPCKSDVWESGEDELKSYSYALVGDMTYQMSSKSNVSFGMRISVDDKNFKSNLPLGNGITQQILGDNLLGPNSGGKDVLNQKTFIGYQPKFSLDYSLVDDLLIYGSYARGFKAGGFNNVSALSFDSETSNAFELGLKYLSKSGKFKLNSSIYYTDYNDLQDQTIGASSGLLVIDNATSVTSQGIEIESSFSVTEGFTIIGNTSLAQARYNMYVLGENDFSENSTPRSPDQSFSIISDYKRNLKSFGIISIRADYSYQSKVYFSRENLNALSQDGYGLFNANISLSGIFNGRINLTIYGHNLLDKNYIIQAEDPIGTGTNVLRSVPRLIGVKLNYNLIK